MHTTKLSNFECSIFVEVSEYSQIVEIIIKWNWTR